MKSRRLILLAGYNARGVVDASLVHMVQQLSKYGDIILVMDNDADKSELDKISPYVIWANATRHCEYDFGSYRRAYTYARDTKILSQYDYVYMINDSVYGPLFSMDDTFENLEKPDADALGLVWNPNTENPHIQSWFIGMRPCIFKSDWFDKFITSVVHQEKKGMVVHLYEHGFTQLVRQHSMNIHCIYTVHNRGVYNDIKKLFRAGMPFMKKCAFTRHNGRLGAQISYVLRHISPDIRDAILSSARDSFGDKYLNWLLTRNPFKIMYRSITYGIKKFCTGKL